MNPWKIFEQLLPEAALEVGTVLAHEGNNSRVQLPAGDIVLVRGTPVAAGHMAYLRSGEVIGAAPDLAVVEMEV